MVVKTQGDMIYTIYYTEMILFSIVPHVKNVKIYVLGVLISQTDVIYSPYFREYGVINFFLRAEVRPLTLVQNLKC